MKKILTKEEVYCGNLILVNEEYEYRQKENIKMMALNENSESIYLQGNAVKALDVLMDSIKGWKEIQAVSGWRSYDEQTEIYHQTLIENGEEFTEQFVALPGHSEHQTGLAIDLGKKHGKIDFIRPDFPYEGICQLFRTKAPLFGFIERYLESKEDITKIAHEPWHFRYVGFPHAQIIVEKKMVLEEYIQFIKGYPYNVNEFSFSFGNIDGTISYINAKKDALVIEIQDDVYCSVSGDNSEGFIITKWKYHL